MALFDEPKLQANIVKLVSLLTNEVTCCKVVAATFASSSLIAEGVFVTVDQKGGIVVYDSPGGSVLTPAEYGVLTKP